MQGYKLLILDADGTLFDYQTAQRYALGQLCRDLELPFSDELLAAFREANDSVWEAFERKEISSEELKSERFSRFAERMSLQLDAKQASRGYLQYLGTAGFLFDGALELLSALKEHYQLALLTNGLAATQRGRLQAAGIEDYFHPVVISEEAGVQKPDPSIFSYLLEQAHIDDRNQTLMIGDSLTSDIAGGNASGIDTCLLDFELTYRESETNRAYRPTYIINSYGQLLKLLTPTSS
ncbi:MAG: YjjG family noncanonical pyrimidine nucleotidase [Spirochaetota bacterium]